MKVRRIKIRNKFIIVLLALVIGIVFCASSGICVTRAETNNFSDNYELVGEYSYDYYLSSYLYNSVETHDLDYTIEYVYTSNGSSVAVYKINKEEEFDQSEIDSLNATYDNRYPNTKRIGNASQLYNCHSYAWYQQSTSNPYWMDDPSAYYTDGSYVETTNPKVGDRVCYISYMGKNLHSGIVASIGNSDDISSIKVDSKWGLYGLYRHDIYSCPYASQYGGLTESVKFYTHATHKYNSRYENYNELKHRAYCMCGDYELVSHYVKASTATGRYANCAGCGALLDLYKYYYPGIMKFKPSLGIYNNVEQL